MSEIKAWDEDKLATGDIEENSSLGKAVKYFIKHYDGLTHFAALKAQKLTTTELKRCFKIVVRDRKNTMFKKTLFGANIGDVITAMIGTGNEAV